MLVAAVGYGARDVSRLRYTTELTGDALGIGAAAVAFAGGLAVGGVASGPLSDRIDPRWILVVGPPLQGLAPGPAFRRSPRRRQPWCPRMPAVRPRSSASCDWGWERRWGSSSRASVPTRWPLSSASAFCSAQPPCPPACCRGRPRPVRGDPHAVRECRSRERLGRVTGHARAGQWCARSLGRLTSVGAQWLARPCHRWDGCSPQPPHRGFGCPADGGGGAAVSNRGGGVHRRPRPGGPGTPSSLPRHHGGGFVVAARPQAIGVRLSPTEPIARFEASYRRAYDEECHCGERRPTRDGCRRMRVVRPVGDTDRFRGVRE